MKSKERVITFFANQEPDRVPINYDSITEQCREKRQKSMEHIETVNMMKGGAYK